MRKTAAAAAMAASLTIGGGAGAVLFAPNLVGAQTDDAEQTDDAGTDETDRPEKGAFLQDALAPLVEDGTIDQGQADAVIAALEEARPADRRGGPGHHRPFDGAVLDTLGVSAEDLRTALADGQTLAEVAEANGVDVDTLVDAMVAEVTERLDQAVENERLTEDEAAEKLADASERITGLVNGDIEFEGRRGHRGPAGHGGPGADASDDADETTGS